MDTASRRLALAAALMTVMADPAWGLPGIIAPAERPALTAVSPLPAGPGPAPERAAPGLASSAPDDPPPLTPILDPAPLDPPPPLLIVERTGPAPGPLSAAPAPVGHS